MNKTELIEILAKKTNAKAYMIERMFDGFVDIVKDVTQKGGVVQVRGLGSFLAKEKLERLCFNPITKRPYYSARKKYIVFKLSKKFKYSL